VDATTSLSDYLNGVFTLMITGAALLAVAVIAFQGLKYMASDVIGKKAEALAGLRGAFLGLIILILSYVILHVINPNILNFDLVNTDLNSLGRASTPAAGTASRAAGAEIGRAIVEGAPALVNNSSAGADLFVIPQGVTAATETSRIAEISAHCQTNGKTRISVVCQRSDGFHVARPTGGCGAIQNGIGALIQCSR
jgi:hypothetical protein